VISSVIFASIAVYSWKLLGYLIPARYITASRQQLAERITVSLLAALVVLQGFALQNSIVLDARAASLAVAAVLLALRGPYILVVLAGALTATGLRALGL